MLAVAKITHLSLISYLYGRHAHLLCRLQVATEVVKEHRLAGRHAETLQGDVKESLVWLPQLLNTRLNHL